MLRTILQRLALIVLPTVALFGGVEVIVRVTGMEQRVAAAVSRRMYPVQPGHEDDLFATRMFDPVLSWRLKPNGVLPGGIARINSLGFVGEEFTRQKAPGTVRVLTLGDSVTYGVWGCDLQTICRDNPYPTALERRVRGGSGGKGGDGIEVINAGVYGYGSLQGLRYYRTDLGDLDAEIVTVMFGWNDHGVRRGLEGRELHSRVLQSALDAVAQLASYRTLVGLTTRVLMAVSTPQPAAPGTFRPRASPEDFAYNLEELVRTVHARGARIVLITEPIGEESEPYKQAIVPLPWVIYGLQDYATYAAVHAQYNDRTRAVAQRLNVALIDADREFTQRNRAELFSPYDLVHPNEAGHALIAELIYQRLVNEGWLRVD